MTPEQIRSLLRERAKDQMPDGYTERLLRQLHQRQRAELLNKSVWQIGMERISTFLSEHSLSTPRYALAIAAILAFFIGLIALVKPTGGDPVMAKQEKLRSQEDPLRQRIEAQHVSFEK
jgi:hypothetical protein